MKIEIAGRVAINNPKDSYRFEFRALHGEDNDDFVSVVVRADNPFLQEFIDDIPLDTTSIEGNPNLPFCRWFFFSQTNPSLKDGPNNPNMICFHWPNDITSLDWPCVYDGVEVVYFDKEGVMYAADLVP